MRKNDLMTRKAKTWEQLLHYRSLLPICCLDKLEEVSIDGIAKIEFCDKDDKELGYLIDEYPDDYPTGVMVLATIPIPCGNVYVDITNLSIDKLTSPLVRKRLLIDYWQHNRDIYTDFGEWSETERPDEAKEMLISEGIIDRDGNVNSEFEKEIEEEDKEHDEMWNSWAKEVC